MSTYQVSVTRTVTEYWEVEADSKEDAKMLFEYQGEQTYQKEHDRDIWDVEEK